MFDVHQDIPNIYFQHMYYIYVGDILYKLGHYCFLNSANKNTSVWDTEMILHKVGPKYCMRGTYKACSRGIPASHVLRPTYVYDAGPT